ncbi:hypothetical protein [Streptomyces sp. NPDC060366]|uniref:hypothetical protein n=1 Tax=Streptomyces sp. NPDC060366 TaxID=3347105 RepID=UPI003668670F
MTETSAERGQAEGIITRLRAELAASERIRENADFHLGQEMARRQLAEKESGRLRAELEQARTAKARVTELHQQYRFAGDGTTDYCAHCNQISGGWVPWPCPTLTALTAARSGGQSATEWDRAVAEAEAAGVVFGAPDCSCAPFVRQDGVTRYCDPDDTVDQISGWERRPDCPYHAPPAAEANEGAAP